MPGTIWDRISQGTERLLGLPGRGLLDQDVQELGRQRGLLSLGSSLLQSAQTTDPNRAGLAGALGAGLEAGRAGALEGVQLGQALQGDELVAARQAVFARYQGRLEDPTALRQMAGELASIGDNEGAKLVLDMVETGAAGAPTFQLGVDPETGERAPFMVDPTTSAATRVRGMEPPIEPLVGAQNTVRQGYETVVKPIRDYVRYVGDILDLAEKSQKERTFKGPTQIALARAFVEATTPEAARFRSDAQILDPANTVWDRLEEMVKKFNVEGQVSVLPTTQIEDAIKVMRALLRRNEENLYQAYSEYRGLAERYWPRDRANDLIVPLPPKFREFAPGSKADDFMASQGYGIPR